MRGDSEGTNNTTGDFSTGTTPRRRDSIIRRQAPVLPMSKLYAKYVPNRSPNAALKVIDPAT